MEAGEAEFEPRTMGLQVMHVNVNTSELGHAQASWAVSDASSEDTGKVMGPRICPLCHCLNLGERITVEPPQSSPRLSMRAEQAAAAATTRICSHNPPFSAPTSLGLRVSASPPHTEPPIPITFPMSASLSSFQDMFKPQDPAWLGILMKTGTGSRSPRPHFKGKWWGRSALCLAHPQHPMNIHGIIFLQEALSESRVG